jgi:hypothetical protein
MFLPKLPEDYQYSLLFINGTGRQLDMLGQTVGLRRRILEPEVLFRWRLAKHKLKLIKDGGVNCETN